MCVELLKELRVSAKASMKVRTDGCYVIAATRMYLEAIAAMVNFGRSDNHGFACSNKR